MKENSDKILFVVKVEKNEKIQNLFKESGRIKKADDPGIVDALTKLNEVYSERVGIGGTLVLLSHKRRMLRMIADPSPDVLSEIGGLDRSIREISKEAKVLREEMDRIRGIKSTDERKRNSDPIEQIRARQKKGEILKAMFLGGR